MVTLQPYRAGATGISVPKLRRMPANSPVTKFAGAAIIAIWLGAFIFGFPRVNAGGAFVIFALVLVATIGIPLGLNLGWHVLVSMRLGEPEMRINTNRIWRGTELQCEFVQPVKTQMMLNEAKIQLAVYEWVRYTEGTNTRTATNYNVIDEIAFDGEQKNAGEEIWLKANFRIPQNAMHNFNFSENRLQWLLIVTVGMQGWPDFYEEYPIDFDSDVR